MREENKTMQNFLKQYGINCRVKYIWKGSLRHRWRLYNPNTRWHENPQLWDKLNKLGFKDFDGSPLGKFSGNGGVFSILVCGNYDKNPFLKPETQNKLNEFYNR